MFATDAVLSSRREFDANHSPWTVYRGLLNARAVATWMVPTGMTSHVQSFGSTASVNARTGRCAHRCAVTRACRMASAGRSRITWPLSRLINYFAYNFIKIHRTLRVSPAMAAGVTTRLFEVSDLVALLVESESRKAA